MRGIPGNCTCVLRGYRLLIIVLKYQHLWSYECRRRPIAAVRRDTPPRSRFKIKFDRLRAQSSPYRTDGRQCQLVSCQPRAADACRVVFVWNSQRFDHGSAPAARRYSTARRARLSFVFAALARRPRPHLQQPQGCLQEQEDGRTGARLLRLPDMLYQLARGEQRHGE